MWGLLNQELKALCVNWDELTVGRCSHCRAARDLLYESQFSENGARLGVFHDDVADCNHRFEHVQTYGSREDAILVDMSDL